jgi:hypothetical protein
MDWLRCVHCGEVIGVYDPVFLSDGSELEGSKLTLGAELERAGIVAFDEQRCGSGAETHGGQRGRPDRVDEWGLFHVECS